MANDRLFSFVQRDKQMNALILEPQEGTNSQTDMVALGNFETKLSVLNASELLEVAMIGFNRPGRLGGGFAGNEGAAEGDVGLLRPGGRKHQAGDQISGQM